MNDWQDRDDGDAALDGWYAILVFWGTPWEEDSPDVFKFKNGAWVEQQDHLRIPDFNYFQGPFQSYAEARNWGHANDPASKWLDEQRAKAAKPGSVA
jgi:hypothetical protein